MPQSVFAGIFERINGLRGRPFAAALVSLCLTGASVGLKLKRWNTNKECRMKCLFVPAFVICASTALATPFDGVYRFNNSWDCVSIGSDGGAIAIKGNIFRGVENDCTLENAVQVRGMNATLYDADCTGEGLYSRERIMLMRKTYGADGIYLIRNGIVGEFERCPS